MLVSKSHRRSLFHLVGQDNGSLRECSGFGFSAYYNLAVLTIGDDSVAVVAVVVVQRTRGIDVAGIVGVGRVRGTKPHKLSNSR